MRRTDCHRLRFILAVTLGLSALTGNHASADSVLFDGEGTFGQAGPLGGNNYFAQGDFVAEAFTLGQESNVTGLTFNAFTAANTVPITAVHYMIYQGTGFKLGGVLESGSTTITSSMVTGSNGQYTLKDFNAALPSFDMGAGTYYLGLKVDPTQINMHWTITGFSGTGFYDRSGTGTPTDYATYGDDQAFRILGTAVAPLPSAAAGSAVLIAAAVMAGRSRKLRSSRYA